MVDSVPIVLVLSGLDPTGGAGITADIRALATLDVHTRALVTANTIQGPRCETRIVATSEEHLAEQVRIAIDEGFDAVKTGLVPDQTIAMMIARLLPPSIPLVVDPVICSTHGHELVTNHPIETYGPLIARADVVTPNASEARVLTGHTSLEEGAWALRKMGAKNVLITGGDEPGDTVMDLLLTSDGELVHYDARRIHAGRVRGTGCTLASLLAGHIAQGYSTKDAVLAAIEETRERIQMATMSGHEKILPTAPRSLHPDARSYPLETRDRIAEVAAAWRRLRPQLPRHVVPEVGSNLAYLPSDGDATLAAVLSARCFRSGLGIVVAGPVEIGGAHHTARIASVAHALDERVRCAMNVRHRPELVTAALAEGLTVANFRRKEQPASEPSTVAWGTRVAFESAGRTPDVIYDLGGHGKEPMMRILGGNPREVVGKVERVLHHAT